MSAAISLAWPMLLTLAATSADASPRTWTDSTGKFSVEAEFLGMEDGNVLLCLPTGRILKIPRKALSGDDQRYIPHALKRLEAAAEDAAGEEATAPNRALRIWTATSGQRLLAKFVEASTDTVRLKRKDGVVISVPLASLVEDDQKTVANHLARRAEARQRLEEEKHRRAKLPAEFKIRPNEREQEIDGKKVLLIEVRIPQGASFFSDTGSRTAEEHMRKQLAPFRDRRRAAEETGLFDRVELVSP